MTWYVATSRGETRLRNAPKYSETTLEATYVAGSLDALRSRLRQECRALDSTIEIHRTVEGARKPREGALYPEQLLEPVDPAEVEAIDKVERLARQGAPPEPEW